MAANHTLVLQVVTFRRLAHLAHDDVDVWLAAKDRPPGASGMMALQPSLDWPALTRAIEKINEAIRAGETDQVACTANFAGISRRQHNPA